MLDNLGERWRLITKTEALTTHGLTLPGKRVLLHTITYAGHIDRKVVDTTQTIVEDVKLVKYDNKHGMYAMVTA